jgi:hypothetical protein
VSWRRTGEAARAARRLRGQPESGARADHGAVLLLDGGDLFQGRSNPISTKAPLSSRRNALGYAASAIGNHEFDFGPAGELQTPRAPGDDRAAR